MNFIKNKKNLNRLLRKIPNIFNGGLALFTLCSLTACSSVTHSSYVQKAGLFPDRDALYMQGQSLPSLKTPQGAAPIPNDPYFIIPSAPGSVSSTPVSIIPPGSQASSNTSKISS